MELIFFNEMTCLKRVELTDYLFYKIISILLWSNRKLVKTNSEQTKYSPTPLEPQLINRKPLKDMSNFHIEELLYKTY